MIDVNNNMLIPSLEDVINHVQSFVQKEEAVMIFSDEISKCLLVVCAYLIKQKKISFSEALLLSTQPFPNCDLNSNLFELLRDKPI